MVGAVVLNTSLLFFPSLSSTRYVYTSSHRNVVFQIARDETELSSAPAGTRLRGCNILKSGQDPEALPDNEYPDWLWELLDDEAQKRKLDADPEKKARKEWRKKNREKIKQGNFLKSMR
ncbi:hypothetical protein V1521DRAFT_447143 [Lipomyces starkeyi]